MNHDNEAYEPARQGSKVMRHFRIPLRAVFYKEHDIWVAHCLEMDVVGDGASPQEAIDQLSEAIEMQIESSFEHQNAANMFQPADAKFFEMFAAGRDIAVGELSLPMIAATKDKGVEIESMDTREYEFEEAEEGAYACA